MHLIPVTGTQTNTKVTGLAYIIAGHGKIVPHLWKHLASSSTGQSQLPHILFAQREDACLLYTCLLWVTSWVKMSSLQFLFCFCFQWFFLFSVKNCFVLIFSENFFLFSVKNCQILPSDRPKPFTFIIRGLQVTIFSNYSGDLNSKLVRFLNGRK